MTLETAATADQKIRLRQPGPSVRWPVSTA